MSAQAKEIVNNIKQGVLAPIYFLMGEEAFYIDAISNYIEKPFWMRVKKALTKWCSMAEM